MDIVILVLNLTIKKICEFENDYVLLEASVNLTKLISLDKLNKKNPVLHYVIK